MSLLVESVSFAYSNAPSILNKISFEVSEGETLCILGASGSGKSTLLKIITNLIKPNGGKITFNKSSTENLKQQGQLSFMFQDPCLMPNLTVKQNIEFPTQMLGRLFSNTVAETIKSVGLSESIHKLPKDLSGGMRTRTALARSFISHPLLLLLDEAFSGLDQGWRYDLYQELKALQHGDNTTVIVVTHNIEEAIELADTICFLDNTGRLSHSFVNNDHHPSSLREDLKEIIKSDHLTQLQAYA